MPDLRNYGRHLVEIPRDEWPEYPPDREQPDQVFLSNRFLVQVRHRTDGWILLSVNRTAHTRAVWRQGISWDELQTIKNQCGFTERDAVEVYPAQRDVVHVANMRHLWVSPAPLPFAWRSA